MLDEKTVGEAVNASEAREIIATEAAYGAACRDNDNSKIDELHERLSDLRNRNQPIIETLGHIERAKGYLAALEGPEVKMLAEALDAVIQYFGDPENDGERRVLEKAEEALTSFQKAVQEKI